MKKRNKTLIYMCIALFLGYLPWYNFSAVSNYILKDLDLSVGDMGVILSIFQAGYVITVIFTGWLADRVGKKRVISWATLLTGIFSTLFVWFAKGFVSVMILRLLTGLSAGAIFAPGMALLSDWFPKEERGKALGAYGGSLIVAFAGGYFVASPLASYFSWEIGILATSLSVFIGSYILFYSIREPSEREKGIEENCERKEEKSAIKKAPEGSFKGPILVTTSYVGHMWEIYAFWGWIGPFLIACAYAVGYSEARAVLIGGRLAAFIILSGAPASYLLGIVADKLGRINTIILCSISSLLAELFFGYLYGNSLAIVAVIGFWIGFWGASDGGIYKVALTEMSLPRIRSTALGIQSAIGFSATIISPYVFGRLLEIFNENISDPIKIKSWGIPFLIVGIVTLLAPISIYLLKRQPQSKLLAEGDD